MSNWFGFAALRNFSEGGVLPASNHKGKLAKEVDQMACLRDIGVVWCGVGGVCGFVELLQVLLKLSCRSA